MENDESIHFVEIELIVLGAIHIRKKRRILDLLRTLKSMEKNYEIYEA